MSSILLHPALPAPNPSLPQAPPPPNLQEFPKLQLTTSGPYQIDTLIPLVQHGRRVGEDFFPHCCFVHNCQTWSMGSFHADTLYIFSTIMGFFEQCTPTGSQTGSVTVTQSLFSFPKNESTFNKVPLQKLSSPYQLAADLPHRISKARDIGG